jgi:hypothetical protein
MIKLPWRTDENREPNAIRSTPAGKATIQEPKRTICIEDHRETIVDMMATHQCAHPLIPGYTHPSAGVRYWAVQQMDEFCVKHDLREVWAYLWENWYRVGRWELCCFGRVQYMMRFRC